MTESLDRLAQLPLPLERLAELTPCEVVSGAAFGRLDSDGGRRLGASLRLQQPTQLDVGVGQGRTVLRDCLAQSRLGVPGIPVALRQRGQREQRLPVTRPVLEDRLEARPSLLVLTQSPFQVGEPKRRLEVVRLQPERILKLLLRLLETVLALPDEREVEARVRMFPRQGRDRLECPGGPFELAAHQQRLAQVELEGGVLGL